MASQKTALEKARQIKLEYEKILLAKANVVGVGVGYCFNTGQRTESIGLVVMVSRKMPLKQLRPEDVVPAEIEGVPVDVQEVGEINAQRSSRK